MYQTYSSFWSRRRDHSYLLLSFFKFNTVSFCVLSEQVFSRSSDFAIMRNLRTHGLLVPNCVDTVASLRPPLRAVALLSPYLLFPKNLQFSGTPLCAWFVPKRRVLITESIQKRTGKILSVFVWSRRRDSNPRPLGPEPSALPNCATPRFSYAILAQLLYFCNFFLHL